MGTFKLNIEQKHGSQSRRSHIVLRLQHYDAASCSSGSANATISTDISFFKLYCKKSRAEENIYSRFGFQSRRTRQYFYCIFWGHKICLSNGHIPSSPKNICAISPSDPLGPGQIYKQKIKGTVPRKKFVRLSL
jgi:hypothetical protein